MRSTPLFITLLAIIAIILVTMSHQASAEKKEVGLCTYQLPAKRKLAMCSWYNSPDASCCSYDDSVALKNTWEKNTGSYKNATVGSFLTKVVTDTVYRSCVQQLEKFICWHCKPAQINYVLPYVDILNVKVGYKLNVCQSYCDSMYSSCLNLPTGDGAQLVRQKYSNSNDFCTGFLAPLVNTYRVAVVDDNPTVGKCFSSASTFNVRSTLIATVLIAVIIGFFGL